LNNKEVAEYREDLKSRIVRIETIVERVETQLCKLNSRTSSLENWRSWMAGGMALLGLVLLIIAGIS
tara:strand:+ start:96 stop:296 length:201 start_codon:yes stop_codon:yes gene_type:complete